MIDCTTVSDRMPEVARGTAAWTEAEADHLLECAECAREWRLVVAGGALQANRSVAADRIADAVLARLRAAPAPVRRIPWRGGVIGLLAAAAVLIMVNVRRPGQSPEGTALDTTIVSMVPELQGLDEAQLNTVLQSLDTSTADAAAQPEVRHLDDLTDLQLERLLNAMGGE